MPLRTLIGRLIELDGPLDLARYWALCQSHPEHGYYSTRDPLGVAGDFVTAPEISQLFGELAGLALAQAWLDRGAPARVLLVEIGPGRGTLMVDALRAAAVAPGFIDAAELHLVETSPTLRACQASRLTARWHDDLDGVTDDAPMLLIANELLDALPIRQMRRLGSGWRELRVGVEGEGRLGLTAYGQPLPLPVDAPDGAVLELAPAREALVAAVAHRLRVQGGIAYLIDYGHDRDPPIGDTLQAVRGHLPIDPFAAPGTCDLTSHVAFAPLSVVARRQGATAWGPVTQATWLMRLGMALRLERLTLSNPERAAALAAGAARLVEPWQMGELFKVLALSGDGITPPGLMPEDRTC